MKRGKSERKDPPFCWFPYATFLMKAEVTHFFNGVVGVILLIISIATIPSASGFWVPKKHLLTHRVFGALRGLEKHAIFSV